MRSYSSTVDVTVDGYAYYEWDFIFNLSQEEIQYIYYNINFSGATTGFGTQPSYYEIYINGIKYIQVYGNTALGIPGFGLDAYINVLNSVRVLSNVEITIKFFHYVRSSFGPITGTMNCFVKTIK